jgi:UDP-N-acetylmuramate--alanine ligase
MCGAVLEALALPATVLVGSAVSSFGGRCTCAWEAASSSPRPASTAATSSTSTQRIVLTSVDHDHQDYFPAYADILSAFVEYGRLLPPGGELIYCADDAGAVEAPRRSAPSAAT